MANQYLYEFVVKEKVVASVTTQREIDGKTLDVIEKVETLKDRKAFLVKPSRRVVEGADIFYAKSVNDYMQAGLMSVHLLTKRYDNDGGPYTDEEKTRLSELRTREGEISKIYFEEKVKFQRKESTEETLKDLEKTLVEEMRDIQLEIEKIQSPYASIFNQTAEYKARNKTVLWWLFALLRFSIDEGPPVPFFKTPDYELNMDYLEKIEESGSEFEQEIVKRALLYVTYWSAGHDLNNAAAIKILDEEFAEAFKKEETVAPTPQKETVNESPQ